MKLRFGRRGPYKSRDKILAIIVGIIGLITVFIFTYYFIIILGFMLKIALIFGLGITFIIFYKKFIPLFIILSPLIIVIWLIALIF